LRFFANILLNWISDCDSVLMMNFCHSSGR
jgi:hypothetical protein